jgi:sec-independent protein translocase protein TatA
LQSTTTTTSQATQQQAIDREKLESIADTLGIDYSNKNDQDLKIAIEEELKKTSNKK